MIIKAYRQDLRNFINDNKEKILNGEKIEFPPQPDFIDLNNIHTLFFLGFALFFLGLALFFLAFTIPAFLGQMCQSGKFNVSRLLTSSEL